MTRVKWIVAVCCSALQCVAVCCSVLQRVTVSSIKSDARVTCIIMSDNHVTSMMRGMTCVMRMCDVNNDVRHDSCGVNTQREYLQCVAVLQIAVLYY